MVTCDSFCGGGTPNKKKKSDSIINIPCFLATDVNRKETNASQTALSSNPESSVVVTAVSVCCLHQTANWWHSRVAPGQASLSCNLLGPVSRSVPTYLIARCAYDNELVTLLTVRNVHITLGVPVSHKRESSHT